MARESFLFFSNMRDVIKSVPREKQLELREAIEDYIFDGIEPEDWAFKAIIQSLKPFLCRGRGAPAGNENAKKETENNSNNSENCKTKNSIQNKKINSPELKQKNQFTETETKKSIQNKKINSNKKNNSANCPNCETKKTKEDEKRKKEKIPPAPLEEEKNKKIPLSGYNAPTRARENAADEIIFKSLSGWFDENIGVRLGIPSCKKALPERIHRLRDRIDEAGSVDEFKKIVSTAFEESGFLRGEKGGFRADFDAVCSEKIFSKMREGGYRDHKARPSSCDPWGEGAPL